MLQDALERRHASLLNACRAGRCMASPHRNQKDLIRPCCASPLPRARRTTDRCHAFNAHSYWIYDVACVGAMPCIASAQAPEGQPIELYVVLAQRDLREAAFLSFLLA